MDSVTLTTLQKIGAQFDAGIQPLVIGDGFIVPNNLTADYATMGTEKSDEQQGTSGSAAGSWKGSSGRERPACGPWTSDTVEPSGCGSLRQNYLGQLDAVVAAYPRTQHWIQDEGMWLAVESPVLAGLDRRATFLVAIPFTPLNKVQGWAFWTWSIGFEWIGPRHTNAVDGSICAFNPREGTWKNGDNLVTLIDLYTAWTLQHLHLKMFGWWPGGQTAEYVFERLTELKDNERCGCKANAGRYVDCCKPKDLNVNTLDAAVEFVGEFLRFQPRQPPSEVLEFLLHRHNPPKFRKRIIDQTPLFRTCLSRPTNTTGPSIAAGIALEGWKGRSLLLR